MSLKDLTAEKHKNAERTEFAKLLLSGKISEQDYAHYLLQMLEVYSVLEDHAAGAGLFADLNGLARAPGIWADYAELNAANPAQPRVLQATQDYITYLNQVAETRPNDLLAHLYVRHMGDLYGGQMIAKRVPGSGKFYEFTDKDGLIAKVRAKLDDSLGDEANVAFDHAIKIMKELNESSLVHAD
jgi:heme oxygenase (biliverdin-producing, ferredoxin)